MRKKFNLVLISLLIVLSTGCFKRDQMENITIYTSVYPIEYLVNRLYENNAKIYSIYPDGIDPSGYKLTDKQLSDYSKSDLFIFNGLSNESNYAVSIINKNKRIKIIDISQGMEFSSSIEELWLNPNNLLMIAQNIRKGLTEYISNPYLIKEIDNNYEKLKLDISEIDAELKRTAESTYNKTIVVSNDLFLFLQKYDFNIISIDENDTLTEKTVSDVSKLINNGSIKYIYTKKGEPISKTVQKLIDTTGVSIIELDSINNITEQARNEKSNYISIMNNNIELLRRELFK